MEIKQLVKLAEDLNKADTRTWEYVSLKSLTNPDVETRLFQLSTDTDSGKYLISIVENKSNIELIASLSLFRVFKEYEKYPGNEKILSGILASVVDDETLVGIEKAAREVIDKLLPVFEEEETDKHTLSATDFTLDEESRVCWNTTLKKTIKENDLTVDTELELMVSDALQLSYSINVKISRGDVLEKKYNLSRVGLNEIVEDFNAVIGIISVEFPELIENYCNTFYIVNDGE